MKVLSAETTLGSATNISKASVVRLYNSDSSAIVVTKKDSGGTTIGSFTIGSGKVVYCEKGYTDTLEGGAAVKASQVAYSNLLTYISGASGGGGGSSAWKNDGTTWSSLMSVPTSSFDISPTKAFDTTRQTAQEGDAARTSGNAPMVIFDLSGSNAQTVYTSIYVQAITGYSHWIEITVDGSTYTQTPSNGVYTWNISGELTKIRLQNDNPNGRTYLEGIKLDDVWMTDDTVD